MCTLKRIYGNFGMFTIFTVSLALISRVLSDSINPYNSNTSTPPPELCPGADTSTLVLVHCIFRHGNRTRDTREGFKDDLHSNESDWMPVGMGQLTPIGRNTEYQLGLFLRRRYDGFLPRTYFYRDISVVSSSIYRTMESAQLVCAGLYSPPIEYNRWGDAGGLGTHWQPVPVQTIDGEEDLWIDNHVPCPPYEKEYDDVLVRQFARENEANKDLYDLLSKNTGANVSDVRQVAKIYNTLKVDDENNKTLPGWATPELLSKLERYRLLGFQVRTQTDLMKTIKAGPLFNRLLEILNNKTRQVLSPDNKMILYSGHDTTLIATLNSLGATTQWAPEYGACLMIELHKIDDKYYVRLYYLKSGLEQTVENILLQDWKNSTPIPLEMFNGLLNKYQISARDWYKKCGQEQCVLSSLK